MNTIQILDYELNIIVKLLDQVWSLSNTFLYITVAYIFCGFHSAGPENMRRYT